MKKIFALAAIALATTSAYAATEAESMHFLAGVGLTGGGDKLGTVTYRDGHTANINSGGLIAVYGGIDYRFANRFSFQTTIGYHVDDQTAKNGSIRFERYPLEILGYYGVSDQVRLGGGMRYVMSPKIVSDGVVAGNNLEFDNTTGAILEGEYLFSPKIGLKLRAVSETYKTKGTPTYSYNANHFGAYFNFYF